MLGQVEKLIIINNKQNKKKFDTWPEAHQFNINQLNIEGLQYVEFHEFEWIILFREYIFPICAIWMQDADVTNGSIINKKMETKSEQQNHSFDDNKTSPSSSTVRYLRDKSYIQSFRKGSADSELDRRNFCCNIQNSNYSVMRVYIDAMNEKQVRLYYTKFTPTVKKGQICIIHGYGESTDDYLIMAEYFTKRGYVINMIDIRGFGYSGGCRVNEPTKKILADIETLLRNCCERDLRTFIIAYDLGAVLLNALLQENTQLSISGVINIAPLLSFVGSNRSIMLQRMLLKINPTVFENILLHNMINPTALTKQPHAIKQKLQNSSCQSFITLKMVDQYQKVCQKVRSEGYKFIYPTLFCCGGKDTVQDLNQIKSYYNSLSSQDKQLIVFREGYHELHNDLEADELMMRMFNWMESRKDRVKWKQPLPLKKEGIWRRSRFRFWGRFLIVVAILVFVVGLIRKYRLSLANILKLFKS